MDEPGRTHAAAEWWRGLSGAWRANVGLYCLATLALAALVAQIVTGGGKPAQRVEVASRAPISTAPTLPRSQIPTTAPPTTAPGPAPAEVPAPPAPQGPTAPNTPPPPAPLSVGPFVPEDPTTIPAPACRNSDNPDCGPFFWDPAPAPNQLLNVAVTSSGSPRVNDVLTFTVRVTDPDHLVTNNCAQVNYGDGVVDSLPCTRAECPNAHGPWNPPPQIAGDETFTFRHQYGQVRTYTPSFTFHTDFDAPCPSPYGSANTGQTTVTVTGP